MQSATQLPVQQAHSTKGGSTHHRRRLRRCVPARRELLLCTFLLLFGVHYFLSLLSLSWNLFAEVSLQSNAGQTDLAIHFRAKVNATTGTKKIDSKPQDGRLSSLPSASNRTNHMIFSTSCSDQQNWQAFLFFFHAHKVQQPGTVTRICSCDDESKVQSIREFHAQHIQPMNSQFYLHVTPSFSSVKKRNGTTVEWKYMNKPFGVKHWLDQAHQEGIILNDDVVVLLDPDQVLLKPITGDFSGTPLLYEKTGLPNKPFRVEHGKSMAQSDVYSHGEWTTLNATYIVGQQPSRSIPRRRHSRKAWNAAPPYLATVQDWSALAPLWTQYSLRILELTSAMYVEMYAYSWASFLLNLPHTLVRSFQVSQTTRNGEGIEWIDQLTDQEICMSPSDHTRTPLPLSIHYCQLYGHGRWFFSKYHLRADIFSCEAPLLEQPPADLAAQRVDHWMQPRLSGMGIGWKHNLTSTAQARREAFFLCQMIRSINEAAQYFKDTSCSAS